MIIPPIIPDSRAKNQVHFISLCLFRALSDQLNTAKKIIENNISSIYYELNKEANATKNILPEASSWIWNGEFFARSDQVAIDNPVRQSSKYLPKCPLEYLHRFKILFSTCQVRQEFSRKDYCQVIQQIHKEGKLDNERVETVVAILNHISSKPSDEEEDLLIITNDLQFLPVKSPQLVYLDAEWLNHQVNLIH